MSEHPLVKPELDLMEFCSWCDEKINWDDPEGEFVTRIYRNQFGDLVRVAKHESCYRAWLMLDATKWAQCKRCAALEEIGRNFR